MKKFLIMLATGSITLVAGNVGLAQEEQEEEASEPAVPVELYACKYNEGMGPDDLDKVIAKWNKWADDREMNDYSAWTLTKFYAGPEQDFDVAWLGAARDAKTLGREQDDWIANGGELQAEFDRVAPCNAHANFAAVNFKQPPEDDDPPSNIVLSFSDCNIADGKNFGDVAPALEAWADYRTGHGSTAGIWVLFPAYGGGGEEFDFKYVTGHRTHEQQGADWDEYAAGGYAKAAELFGGLLDCDSARVYNAQNRRRAADEEEE